jgi:hypothetical protein
MHTEVRIAMIVATAFIMFVGLIAGGMTLDSYFHKQNVSECIQADKVWAENACVPNVNDLRYVDND